MLVAVLGTGAMWFAVSASANAAETASADAKIHALHLPDASIGQGGQNPAIARFAGCISCRVYETGKGTNAPPATAKTNSVAMPMSCCAGETCH